MQTAARLWRKFIAKESDTLNNENTENTSSSESEVKTANILKEAVPYLLTFVFTILFFKLVVTLNYVPTGSMEPTITTKSVVVSWRIPYLINNPVPNRGDVVTFYEQAENPRILIKRVIGLPGDTIAFKSGKVYLNGEELDEPYLMTQNSTSSIVHEFNVPEGHIFVMGDNREHSNDSRFTTNHYVPLRNVIAKELFHFKPFFVDILF